MYQVTFTDSTTGRIEMSRILDSQRKAVNWAKWLLAQSFAAEVSVYRGGAGGELVSRTAKAS